MLKFLQNLCLLLVVLSNSTNAQNWPPVDSWGTITWTGLINSNYNNPSNWSTNKVPVQETIIIPNGTPHKLITNIPQNLVHSLILEPGVNLKIDGINTDNGYIWLKSDPNNDLYSQLTLTQDSELDGPVLIAPGSGLKATHLNTYDGTVITLESTSKTYSSLIINSEIKGKGTVHYKRHTNKIGTTGKKGGNDLISSPLTGVSFNAAFVAANPMLAKHPTKIGEYAFAPYNVTAGAYQNFDLGTSSSTPIVSGKGYRAATTDGSSLTFTGKVITQDVQLEITKSEANVNNSWILLGNPYSSYIDFKKFFNENKKRLHSDFMSIYGYSSSSKTWTVWNQATIDAANSENPLLITPGQGFFIKVKKDGGQMQFKPEMRTIGTSDDFILGRSENQSVALSKLNLSSASNTALTSVYFIEGTTKGMDEGYDAASFSGVSADFSIFTNPVESNKSLDLAIQSLPYTDFNDVILPLGIKAKAGIELSISIDELSTIPSNINVYLEDTQNKLFTLLNDGAYTFKPTTDLNGADRFNIHYSSKSLSVKDMASNENLRIYTTSSPKTLFIKGALSKSTTANLYDIQGRLVLSKILNSNNTENTMDISTIGTGVYVVQVKNDNQIKTQKVIIK